MTWGKIWAILKKEDNCFISQAVKEQLDLELGSDDVPFKRILNNWKVL